MDVVGHSNVKSNKFVVSAPSLGFHWTYWRQGLETLHNAYVIALFFHTETAPMHWMSAVFIESNEEHYHSLRTRGSLQDSLPAQEDFLLAMCASVEIANKSVTRVARRGTAWCIVRKIAQSRENGMYSKSARAFEAFRVQIKTEQGRDMGPPATVGPMRHFHRVNSY